MKRALLVLALLVLMTAFGACSPVKAEPSDTAGTQSSPINQGITVNTIGFERVNIEALSDDVKNKVDVSRAQQGYDAINSGEDMYLVVYAGERKTAGYSIEIKSIVDNEGQTEIKVAETAPAADAMVEQVLTYPFDIVRLNSGISGNVTLTFDKAE